MSIDYRIKILLKNVQGHFEEIWRKHIKAICYLKHNSNLSHLCAKVKDTEEKNTDE